MTVKEGAGTVWRQGDVDSIVALARASVERFVTTGMMLEVPEDAPLELLHRRAGVSSRFTSTES